MKRISLFIIALIFSSLSSCDSITSKVVYEPESNLEVYFCPQDMCKERLLSLMDASTEIKCTFYDLNLKDVMAELKEKNAEVVVEDSTEIPGFKTYPSDDLMHNKFCIFDQKTVFTGSMNPTLNDNFYNNNNILIIRSEAIAQNYLDEFDELNNGINGKGDKVINPEVMVGDILMENYFCPEDNCKLHIINALKKANTSIYFMIFTFSDEDIGNLVFNKHYLGLDVKGVVETRQAAAFSQYDSIKEFTRLDKNTHTLHHKVFIVDNSTVITGSFNPTERANEGNDENVLIIHDKAIAEKYIKEFEKVYGSQAAESDSDELVLLQEISYNPKGKDSGNEYVKVKNYGESEVNLEYYSISDGKSNMKLEWTILPGSTITFKPKFALRNSEGRLFLNHNGEQVDNVAWDGEWKLNAKEGEILVRKGIEINKSSWQIGQT